MRLSTRSIVVVGALSLGAAGALGGCTPTRSASAGSSPRASAALVDAPHHAVSPSTASQKYPRPSAIELASRLTPLQFEVTQHAGTEPPFQNAYWDNHEPGVYVDVATGEPLFSSRDKFESGTGWPSFTRPIEDGHVVTNEDATLGMVRTEAISASGGSHLGHVFDDGPAPTHQRYCINSASLRFIPVSRLAASGYGAYATSFGSGALGETAPATSNSCTLPPPGKAPGCRATLDVAIFARTPGDERVSRPAGVLDVARGHEGPRDAVQVTFDPSKVAYADLLTAWTKGREKDMVVYTRTDEQKQVAATSAAIAQGVVALDAVPFQRD